MSTLVLSISTDTHTPFGQSVPVSDHPQSNYFFLCLNGINVFKYASCPDIEHQQEESGSNFLPPCIMSAYTLIGFPLSLEPSLFYRLNSCSSLSLSPYYKCFHPFIPFVALCWITSSISMSLLYSET